MRIQVKDFMSSPVKTATGKRSVKEIKDTMERNHIHCVPIVEYTKELPDPKVTIRGIVTSTDFTKTNDGKTPVEDVMTNTVHIINKDSSAKSAAKMMLKHKVHHLVVMDEGKIIGMLSSIDFVSLVAKHTLD